MSTASTVSDRWSWKHWGAVYGSLLALHVFGLWWYGSHSVPPRRMLEQAPFWQEAHPFLTASWPWLDPTLFVHGHPESFSGPAWMVAPRVEYRPGLALGPPHFLDPPVGGIMERYAAVVRESEWMPSPLSLRAQPEPLVRTALAQKPVVTRSSRMVLAGWPQGISLRAHVPPLPAWSAPDMLTNSVVRVLIRPPGRVLSATLLISSGFEPADQKALELARELEFEVPAGLWNQKDAQNGLIAGSVIYEWQSLPPDPRPAS
ncbi:MAG: energy transducer TonB [Verrucomicrobiota bacterium]|nr:energy transducer TonB [Limisphaera sp.]MDW8382819.1 energy transducer TonB [Verrucomicrobiota bacterium]